MFGLANLLLPVLCPDNPDFLWCRNRAYLSGGSAHMVYTEFEVSTRPGTTGSGIFGDYAPCNPDMETGIFACEQENGGTPPPKQCAADFYMYHTDCTCAANNSSLIVSYAAPGSFQAF